MTMNNEYKKRLDAAIIYRAILSEKYRVDFCPYDKTALVVGCTENELALICRELKCSGIYSDILKRGIITNFGYY
jgi:phage-related protein